MNGWYLNCWIFELVLRTGSSLSDVRDHSAQREYHVVAYGKEHEALKGRNCMHP